MYGRAVCVGLLALLAACAPVVTHGPRVEPGLHGVITAGLPVQLCDSTCDVDLVPQVGIGMRWGRAASPGRPGFSLTGTASASVLGSEADLYVQAPPRGDLAAGAGVLASPMHLMPYVQLGRIGEDGSGWYTTQGFVWMPARPENLEIMTYMSKDVRPRYWSPAIAYRRGTRGGAFHVYVAGAFGWADPVADGSGDRQPVRSLMIGATLEERLRLPWLTVGGG